MTRSDLDQFSRFFERNIPFNAALGLRVEQIAPGRAVLRLPFRDDLVGDTDRPAWHGGALAGLTDAAAGAAASTQIDVRDRLASVDLRIDYLRPAPPCDLLAIAEVRRMGNRVAVVNVVVYPLGPDKTPVAEGRGVFNVCRD